MGYSTTFKNGAQVPITRWEKSWAYEEQRRREQAKEKEKEDALRYTPARRKVHR